MLSSWDYSVTTGGVPKDKKKSLLTKLDVALKGWCSCETLCTLSPFAASVSSATCVLASKLSLQHFNISASSPYQRRCWKLSCHVHFCHRAAAHAQVRPLRKQRWQSAKDGARRCPEGSLRLCTSCLPCLVCGQTEAHPSIARSASNLRYENVHQHATQCRMPARRTTNMAIHSTHLDFASLEYLAPCRICHMLHPPRFRTQLFVQVIFPYPFWMVVVACLQGRT